MNKLAILLVALNSFSTLAVANDDNGSDKNPMAAADRMGAFQPAVSVKQRAANNVLEMNIQSDAVVSIKRSTHDKVDRSSQKENLLSAKLSPLEGNSKLRDSTAKASNAFGFSFYSANSYFNTDLDGDGYYSDFSLSFDADYANGSANVYAVVYTSKNGEAWTELLVTGVFNIINNNASDEQTVTSQLNFDFPTNEYDILIDLYEDGIPGIVATISPTETTNLSRLPLEDLEHERSNNLSQISYAATTLFGDADGDGFFTNITLEYDIDTAYSGDTVYAEIVLTNPYAGWSQYLSTDNFILGNQTEFVDLALNSGYPAEWYDMQINLYNAFTGELIATAGSGFLSLSGLPLESLDNDSLFDSPNHGGVDIVIVGGGSMGLTILLMLSLLLARRYQVKLTKAKIL
ncbi:MAG: choice-of-anchor H family protein [Enterobacterales bacterium]|nr:choice-of-anchor H family protein [Enterobacterales bacterium]